MFDIRSAFISGLTGVLFLFIFSCSPTIKETSDGRASDDYAADFENLDQYLNSGNFSKADSLTRVLLDHANQINDDQLAVRAILKKAWIHRVLRQEIRGIDLLEESIALFERAATGKQRIQAQIILANLYMMDGRNSEAFRVIDKAIHRAEQSGDSELLMSAMTSKAVLLSDTYDYSASLELYFKTMSIYDSVGTNPSHRAIMLNNIALNYHKVGKFEEALENYAFAYQLNLQTGNNSELGSNLNNIANTLQELGRSEEAADSLLSAIALDPDETMSTRRIRYHYNLGNIYRETGQLDKAEPYYKQAYEASKELKFFPGMMYHASGLAQLYKAKGKPLEAQKFAGIAREYSENLNTYEILATMWEIIAWAEEQAGNYPAALSAFRIYNTWSDSLNKLTNLREIEEVRTRYEASLMSSENELLRNELGYRENINRKQNQFLVILSAGVIITFIFLFITMSSRRKLKKTYQALSSQSTEITRKNRQLEQLNRDNDTLVGVIVHDLRNPLSGLLGAIELARSNTPADEDNDELLKIAHGLGNRLKSQIDELLEVTSIDKKNIHGDTSELLISQKVTDVMDLYRHRASRKSIILCDDMAPLRINTHEEFLVRILDNLISNAIKYSPHKSRIYVRVSYIGATYWQLEVRDEGPGFSDDDKENLFKLFGKLTNKPTGGEESTGLGLYTVKMLVDKLNGTISLDSEPGRGACFICRFPGVIQEHQAETDFARLSGE